jgi:hypothetical protein
MSENLYKLETTQFSTNLELKLQQQGSKLRGRVAEGFHVGKQASPVQYETAIKSQTPAGRFAPLGRVDSDYERRWVFPQDKEIPQLIDSFDMLKTIVDPKSPKLTNAANAVGRDWDDALILAATGPASIGIDSSSFTQETFSTTNYRITDTFGASATAGLTVAKLREARRILRHYENDLDVEQATLIVGSQQESDLLGLVQVVSTDFNDKPVLVDGKVKRLLGFDIVVMERLPTYTTNVRGCLLFVPGGLYLGMWKETQNTVTIRNDLSGQPWQLYTGYSYGAARLQAGKLLQIGCADSIGAAINP